MTSAPVGKTRGPGEGQAKECRICLESDDPSTLISSCYCAGSVRWTHRSCLARWVRMEGRVSCEICHADYRGLDDVLHDVRHNARLEAEQHEAFLDSELAFHAEHADAVETANRDMQLLWGRFRSVLLVFVTCLLLTMTVASPGGSRPLAAHANNHKAASYDLRDAPPPPRDNATYPRHHGLQDPFGHKYQRHVAGTWERIVHFLFLVLLLRLAALRQRQMRALVDDDPFGLHGTNPFIVPGTILHHWQPTGYRDFDAELDVDDEHSRQAWWYRPGGDPRGQWDYQHHRDESV